MKFSGEYNKGTRHGHGVLTYPDGSKYDGNFSGNFGSTWIGKILFLGKKHG
jgi:MORN repeat